MAPSLRHPWLRCVRTQVRYTRGLRRDRRAGDAPRGRARRRRRATATSTSPRSRAPARRPTSCGRPSAISAFFGVHMPEEYGGGGSGMVELAIVCEEIAAQGCPLLLILVSPAICGELISAVRQRRAEGTLAAADGGGRQDDVRDHRARRRLEQSQHLDDRDARRRRLPAQRRQDVHLRRRRSARDGRRDAHVDRSRRPAAAELSLFIVDTDAPGLERTLIPVEIKAPEKQFQLFFDNVEVPADRLLGDEGEGLRQVFHGLNPERIMSASICTGIGRYALARASEYANDRTGVGRADRPAPRHRASARDRQDRARARAPDDARRPRGCTTTRPIASPRAKRRTWRSTRRPRRALRCLDAAIQTHGGNGMASEYGLADLWGTVAAAAHRAGQPRDGAELRRPTVARPPEVLLNSSCGSDAVATRRLSKRGALLGVRRESFRRVGAGEAEELERERRVEDARLGAVPVVERVLGEPDRRLRAVAQLDRDVERGACTWSSSTHSDTRPMRSASSPVSVSHVSR